MGGKALGFEAARLSQVDYFKVVRQVERAVCDVLPDPCEAHCDAAAITAYRNKPDFGDIDMIVSCPFSLIGVIRADPAKVFPNYSGHIDTNGTVTSIGLNTEFSETPIQLDLIWTGESVDDFMKAYYYFAYNDLGNLVGRIAHRAGFKYGHDGLSYVLRSSDTHVIGTYNFPISNDDLLTFLGFNSTTFNRGFNDLPEIFQFVASSTYFHPSIYLFENVNAVSRIRDRKRSTYTAFLDWCADRGEVDTDLELTDEQKLAFREFMFTDALEMFPEFATWVQESKRLSALRGYSRIFYNGILVSEWTGLKHRELGEFMADFRNFVEGDSSFTFDEWVILMGPKMKEFLITYIREDWNERKK